MNQELKELRDQLDEIARLAREDRAFLVDQVLELRRRIQVLEKNFEEGSATHASLFESTESNE